jgi:hypothetical protein
MNNLLDKIGSHLSSLSLSLTQWALLSLSAIIGILLVVLKLQGSKLHAAQVTILEQHLASQDEKNASAVQSARDRFNQAYQEYKKAKR